MICATRWSRSRWRPSFSDRNRARSEDARAHGLERGAHVPHNRATLRSDPEPIGGRAGYRAEIQRRGEIVSDAIDEMRLARPSCSIELHRTGGLIANVDRTRLEQVSFNLRRKCNSPRVSKSVRDRRSKERRRGSNRDCSQRRTAASFGAAGQAIRRVPARTP